MSRLSHLVSLDSLPPENSVPDASTDAVSPHDAGTTTNFLVQLPVRRRGVPRRQLSVAARDAPSLPPLSFSLQCDKILFLKRRSLPPLSELARPEEKLAGMRINRKSNAKSRMLFYTGIGIHEVLPDGRLSPEMEVSDDGGRTNRGWKQRGDNVSRSLSPCPETDFVASRLWRRERRTEKKFVDRESSVDTTSFV